MVAPSLATIATLRAALKVGGSGAKKQATIDKGKNLVKKWRHEVQKEG